MTAHRRSRQNSGSLMPHAAAGDAPSSTLLLAGLEARHEGRQHVGLLLATAARAAAVRDLGRGETGI
jgi:hypothetical protein